MKFGSFASLNARWLLLVSLCVNVALVTYVAAQWLNPQTFPTGIAMPMRLIERVAERLPSEDAEILWRNYRAKEKEFLVMQSDYVRALGKTVRVIGDPTLDRAALRSAAQEARETRLKIGDAALDLFAETLEQISAKGRRQLVSGFRR